MENKNTILEKVESVLDEVRPAIAQDGGDVSVSKIEGKDVYLNIMGACRSCPMSSVTFGIVVENRLRDVLKDELGDVFYDSKTSEDLLG